MNIRSKMEAFIGWFKKRMPKQGARKQNAHSLQLNSRLNGLLIVIITALFTCALTLLNTEIPNDLSNLEIHDMYSLKQEVYSLQVERSFDLLFQEVNKNYAGRNNKLKIFAAKATCALRTKEMHGGCALRMKDIEGVVRSIEIDKGKVGSYVLYGTDINKGVAKELYRILDEESNTWMHVRKAATSCKHAGWPNAEKLNSGNVSLDDQIFVQNANEEYMMTYEASAMSFVNLQTKQLEDKTQSLQHLNRDIEAKVSATKAMFIISICIAFLYLLGFVGGPSSKM